MRARAQGYILRPLTYEMAAAHIRKGTVWGTRKLLRPPKRTQMFFSVELGQKLATVEHRTRLLSQRNMTTRPQHVQTAHHCLCAAAAAPAGALYEINFLLAP